jgi:hypothetical protein
VKKRKKTTEKSHECTKGHELIAWYLRGGADDEQTRALLLHAQSCTNCARLLRREKRKTKLNKRHECTTGRELVAEYLSGKADEERARELLQHAQSCTSCAELLRNLNKLIHICYSETSSGSGVLFCASPRESPGPPAGHRECAEVHRLIADCVSGEPNDGFPLELLLHVLSCPDCNWLMPILVQVVRAGTPAPSREMPMVVRRELWVTIQREIHTSHRK